MPTLQHNNPASKLIRQYERKERGYSAADKELQRRFVGLDYATQKRGFTCKSLCYKIRKK